MLDKIIPKKITYFFDLIRLKRPIGFMLLMWPCWFALAIIPDHDLKYIIWYLFFFIGSFLMRSAGCIINDLVDIKLDKNITRTSERPLTSNKISIFESLILLFILLGLSLFILLQFRYDTILLALLSLPLIIVYPFLKRITFWPQLGLGIIFSWGVLIVGIEFIGYLNLNFFILYIACIFWTLSYDTIYAYQDREDDIKNNIKSTAVLFGNNGKLYVRLFYSLFFIIIGFLGYNSSQSLMSLIVIIIIFFGINTYLNRWEINSINSSNFYFNFNNIIGLLSFLFLIIF